MCTIQKNNVCPPEIMAYMFPNYNVKEERTGINLQNWNCRTMKDGTIRIISFCDDETHIYVYNNEMRNYYIGPVVFKGRDMHLYSFDITTDVRCVNSPNGDNVFQFELGQSLVIALHKEKNIDI